MNKTMIRGLTSEEVRQRNERGLRNEALPALSKSRYQIYKENVCTLFNLLNLGIALALLWAKAYTNLAFLAIIILNTAIGIIQQLKAKHLIDSLSLLMTQTVNVVRDGSMLPLPLEDLVMDDVMVLHSGEQIALDAQIVQGEVEVNEALLTGEVDAIHKKKDAELLSGSSIISGSCYAKVKRIQQDSYTARIRKEVAQGKEIVSELLQGMRKVTRVTTLMIFPLALFLFLQSYMRDSSITQSIITTAAALLGMLPKGLVLLISVSLAYGVSTLAKRKILIQDLYSLETLAHVDTLCLDKTGTITTGNMQVEDVWWLEDEREDLSSYICAFLYHSDDNNATNAALKHYFKPTDTRPPVYKIPFSSQRKWSAIGFARQTMIMGAPDKLMKEVPARILEAMEMGKRILVVGCTHSVVSYEEPLPDMDIKAVIILRDELRLGVQNTLQYFKEEGVAIRILSGDHVKAVKGIAKKAGVVQYERCIDMSQVPEDMEHIRPLALHYTIFARVTPIQKKLIVKALQETGHCVAMSGDGVNDMLALKQADCSIAIAQGSDAVRQMSQVVLLDSDFSSLPMVLWEGRRVVNNVTRVAGVFFIKTTYSLLLSLCCILFHFPFPFLPIQITLIDAAIEAFPSFLTLLEPNTKAITDRFLPSVFRQAIPDALIITGSILLLQLMSLKYQLPTKEIPTIIYGCVAMITMAAVIHSSFPMNRLRALVCIVMVLGFGCAAFLFHDLLQLTPLTWKSSVVLVLLVLSALCLREVLQVFTNMAFSWRKSKAVTSMKQAS